MSDGKKVKVWNRTKGVHYIVFQDKLRSFPIPAGGSIKVPIDEIYYVNNSSRSFSKGLLEIDQSEKSLLEELGYTKRSPNVYSENELRSLLDGNLTDSVKEELNKITERHACEKLIKIAREMDLPRSKVKFIENLTGMEVYNEFTDEEKEKKNAEKK